MSINNEMYIDTSIDSSQLTTQKPSIKTPEDLYKDFIKSLSIPNAVSDAQALEIIKQNSSWLKNPDNKRSLNLFQELLLIERTDLATQTITLGADPAYVNTEGMAWNSLLLIKNRTHPLFDTLLNICDINHHNAFGLTITTAIAGTNDLLSLQKILDKKPNTQTPKNAMPATFNCIRNHPDALKTLTLLLNYGFSLNDQEQGKSLIFAAASSGNFEIFSYLLNQSNNNLHLLTPQHENIMHAAARGANTQIIDILFDLKVNPTFENIYGETPADVAKHNHIKAILLEKTNGERIKISKKSKKNDDPLDLDTQTDPEVKIKAVNTTKKTSSKTAKPKASKPKTIKNIKTALAKDTKDNQSKKKQIKM